jgi:hypothetical protein
MSDDWENVSNFENNVISKRYRYSDVKYYAEKNFDDAREGMTNLDDGTYLVCSECLDGGIIEIHKNKEEAIMHQIYEHDLLTNNDMATLEVLSHGVDTRFGLGSLYGNVQEILDKKKIPMDAMKMDEGELAEIYIRDQIEADL